MADREEIDLVVKGKAEGLDKIDGALQKNQLSFTELNSALGVAKLSLEAVKKVWGETVQAAIDGAMAQQDLATQMGTTVEEAGALKEMGDDLRVNQSALAMAFKNLNEQGMQPTIENLIKLAGEYQALPDSVSKNQFAQDKFGRSGIEMQKILKVSTSDLAEMAAAARSSSLVFSEDMVNALDETRLRIDSMSDSWQGLKQQYGAYASMYFNSLIQVKGEGILDALANQLKATSLLTIAQKKGVISAEELKEKTGELHSWSINLTDVEGFLAERENELTRERNAGIQTTQDTKQATEGLTEATVEANAANQFQSSLIQDIINKAQAEKQALDDIAIAQGNVAAATQSLADMQASLNQSIGNDAAQALQAAGVQGQAYKDALFQIDTATGTTLTAQQNYKDELAAISAEYAKTGDTEAYLSALVGLRDAQAENNTKIQEQIALIDQLQAKLAALQNKTITLDVQVTGPGAGLVTGGTPIVTTKVGQPKAAGGPVEAGVPYKVGEEGEEWFVPKQSGTIIPHNQTKNMGNTIYNIYTTAGASSLLSYGKLKKGRS